MKEAQAIDDTENIIFLHGIHIHIFTHRLLRGSRD